MADVWQLINHNEDIVRNDAVADCTCIPNMTKSPSEQNQCVVMMIKTMKIIGLVLVLALALPSAAWADRKYASIVVDARSGKVLEATNAEALRHPASLTKIMTLYLTFKALRQGTLRINQALPVSDYAASMAPSKLGLVPGTTIRVRDAILGLVTLSANDAAVVLAEAIGGSESNFARLMTAQARDLGMSKTVYRNASGLPNDGQITTARDMVILGRAIYFNFPEYYRFFSTPSFTYLGRNHKNHNHLMERYSGMDGIKTGFIRASGFNLVASAVHGKTRLIAAIFGGTSARERDREMAVLLDATFAKAARLGIGQSSATPVAQATAPEPEIAQGDSADDDEAMPEKSPAAPVPAPPQAAQTSAATAQPPVPAPPVASPTPASPPTAPPSPVVPPAAVSTTQTAAPPAPIAEKELSDWTVQIGAYVLQASAEQALKKTSLRLLKGVKVRAQIVPVTTAGKKIFRAQFIVPSERDAQKICRGLGRAKASCQITPPRH